MVVSHGNHILGDGEESEAGEDLAARGEGEGGGGHLVVCLVDSVNIQESGGSADIV